MKRFLAIFHARNREFIRDRSTLGWNIILPIVLVIGLGFVFSNDNKPMFKVGVIAGQELAAINDSFLATRYIQFIPMTDRQKSLEKVARHQLDMLLEYQADDVTRYWINSSSPRGYILENMLPDNSYRKSTVEGGEVRYVDWLVPGILGMNMMFSCLFGVGYVIVRYRKSGFLKRLNATPLRAIEFISAQIASRLVLIIAITVAVYIGTDLFLDFMMNGSWLLLLLVTILGAISMIALGLMVSARVSSEELAGGLLNIVTWPMMILSGVWFSLDGTPQIVQLSAQVFPLTHMLDAARTIMIDGGGIAEIRTQLLVLGVMTAIFLAVGALVFKWRDD